MLMLYYVLVAYMFLCGLSVFCSKRKHLLIVLLSLEFMVLCLYLLLFVYLVSLGFELSFSMIFLTFSVCEGALGLSILVSMIRTHGNDFFNSFVVIRC
uniref:NADH dehydrogenase subunit 4L n=1 Tax=Schizodactylus jimo TaxID=2844906 RepID=UPI0022376980|nr:NADH dehydrogenase subunit 4L [Schizodactylus jimo]UYR20467.1 NADH dehydrogenase subunit 4L [Schizodactylus jimo]